MIHWELLVLFFTIALVYASVGFGGGSSYLALLALYNLPFQEIRLTALLCNIIVVTSGVIIYLIHHQVKWKRILPLVLLSVPFAFLGALIKIKEHTFFILLGCTLLLASILLWIKTQPGSEESAQTESGVVTNAIIGGLVGFLSGMVGIGGGIFLSPLLNIMRWDTAKVIAATASVFILANSLAGLAGQYSQLQLVVNWKLIAFLCVAVFAGGQTGSRLGTSAFNLIVIKRVTAVLVCFAGLEVLIRHL